MPNKIAARSTRRFSTPALGASSGLLPDRDQLDSNFRPRNLSSVRHLLPSRLNWLGMMHMLAADEFPLAWLHIRLPAVFGLAKVEYAHASKA